MFQVLLRGLRLVLETAICRDPPWLLDALNATFIQSVMLTRVTCMSSKVAILSPRRLAKSKALLYAAKAS